MPDVSDLQLLTEKQTAKLLGVAPGTLRFWRCAQPELLAFIKVGGKPMYRRADLETFFETRRRGGPPKPAPVAESTSGGRSSGAKPRRRLRS